MNHRASRVLVASAIAAALALTGCSGGDSDAESNTNTSGTTASATGGGSESTEATTSAAAAGIDASNPPKAIATRTLPANPHEELASVKVDLVQLKRDGQVVKAVFGLTPTFVPGATQKQTSLFGAMSNTGPDTRLVDPVNLKLYRMLEEGPGQRLESDLVHTKLIAGTTTYYWAVLTAPPESVSKVNVAFGQGVDMLMDIPIS